VVAAGALVLFGCGRGHASFGDAVDNPGEVPAPAGGARAVTPPPSPNIAPPPSAAMPPFVMPVIRCDLSAECWGSDYCDYPLSARCGKGDATGVCTSPASSCGMTPAPVCGCDGVTYVNACQASAAGVALRSDSAGCDTLDLDAGMM
jgi:hypothetical protein